LHFATLASGSSGNAILVGDGNRHLLVDSGVSAKKVLCNLALLDIDHSQIEGIVVTHEHIDHIRGVGILARKLKIPIYATKPIWAEMENSLGKLSPEQKIIIEDSFSCSGLDIKIFATSHDSQDSYGLQIKQQNYKNQPLSIGIATDSGIITEEMHRHLKGCDGLVVEANHDHEKLWQGRYPWSLKKRVSGNYGHLENKQVAEGLLQWVQENTQRVVLAHLSEENNTPEMAIATVVRILRDSAIPKNNPELRLRVAPRHTPHDLIVLREQ